MERALFLNKGERINLSSQFITVLMTSHPSSSAGSSNNKKPNFILLSSFDTLVHSLINKQMFMITLLDDEQLLTTVYIDYSTKGVGNFIFTSIRQKCIDKIIKSLHS